MPRMTISENEEYPVYSLDPVDPGILAEHPGAGVEMDQSLIDEYDRAGAAWDAVQCKIGAAWRERYGPDR